jgi:hypothetical protein
MGGLWGCTFPGGGGTRWYSRGGDHFPWWYRRGTCQLGPYSSTASGIRFGTGPVVCGEHCTGGPQNAGLSCWCGAVFFWGQ